MERWRHGFVGFEVAKPLLERAFRDIYGLDVQDVLGDEDLALSAPGGDAASPAVELGIRVVAAAAAVAVMETQVGELARGLGLGQWPALVIADHQ